MMKVYEADPSPTVTSRIAEQQTRQAEALKVIRQISHAAGSELPVLSRENGAVDDSPAVYILDPKVIDAGELVDADFQLEKRILSGAANSAHAVIAGDLTVEDAGKHSTTTTVAAKCYHGKRTFEDRLQRARREVDTTRFMQAQNELALEPVAVAVAPESMGNTVVLLTRFDESIYTLDNTPWNRGPNPQNTATAALAAHTLGRFNTYGLRHSDAKIKNIASSSADGRAGMIDFETAERFDIHDPYDAQLTAHTDFGLLVSSLADSGLFQLAYDRKSYQDNTPAIAGVLTGMADSYLANWEHAPANVQGAVYEAVATVVDRFSPQYSHQLPAYA